VRGVGLGAPHTSQGRSVLPFCSFSPPLRQFFHSVCVAPAPLPYQRVFPRAALARESPSLSGLAHQALEGGAGG
jgi:hypothetical protein